MIRVRKNGRWLGTPFLNVRDIVRFDGGECGLLSMAFAPGYAQSRLFCIFYTRSNGNLLVDELRRSPSNADVATRTGRHKVIEIGHSQYSNPSTNPFMGRAGRDESWHYGLRNPWRFSFDRATG